MKTKVEPLDSARVRALVADVRKRYGDRMTHEGKPIPFKVGQKVGWRHGTWTVVGHDKVGSGYRLVLLNVGLPALAQYVNPEMVKLSTAKKGRSMPSEYVRRDVRREDTELGGLLREMRDKGAATPRGARGRGMSTIVLADDAASLQAKADFIKQAITTADDDDLTRARGLASALRKANQAAAEVTSMLRRSNIGRR